ncbi:MAG: hypothetical protein IGNPGNKH_00749 [Sodalis sp. Ffu]|nr:MAG: hypothetical protein IGNPGNKH_00749 [Sodalis sp. Ffu]
MLAEYRFDKSYGAAIKFGDDGGGTYCSGGVAGFLDWDYQYAVVDDDFYCDGDIYREAIVVVDWKGIDSSFLVCNAKGVHRTA